MIPGDRHSNEYTFCLLKTNKIIFSLSFDRIPFNLLNNIQVVPWAKNRIMFYLISPYRKTYYYLVILMILTWITRINSQQIKFKHLGVLEDHSGFLWFGTEDGLNRYDGYSFRIFRSVPGDSTSLSDNIIWSGEQGQNIHL